MPRLLLVTAALCLFALAAACDDDAAPATPSITPTAVALVSTPTAVSSADGDTIELRYPGGVLRVEVADDPEERARGLCCRDVLAADSGMIFRLDQVRVPSFWMKDTRIPLDMIWIDESRRVVGVTADVQPEPGVADEDLQRYSPDVPVRYVLEVNAGAAAQLGIKSGTQLDFDLP